MRLAIALALLVVACSREHASISVGAAASLRNAMPELVERYRKSTGVDVAVTYAATDVLVDQIAHHDAVILAERAALDHAGMIARDSRRALATNSIVLVGPEGAAIRFATLAAMPTDAKIAIGDPATAPVGRYAETYLKAIGSWDELQPRLLLGGDAAGVLALAEQGKARVAIVYATDARRAAPLVVLDQPRDVPTAEIVGGVVAKSAHAGHAREFVDFVASRDGQMILAKHGFGPPRP